MFNFVNEASYTFDTIAPEILGKTFRNAKLLGTLSYILALPTENIDNLQAQVAPYLPTGFPRDPRRYTYLVFQTEAGSRKTLAYEWLVESTIRQTVSTSLVLRVGGASVADGLKIKEILVSAGWNDVQLESS